MSYTKREFIEEAYAEIGMADYVFDLEIGDLNAAGRRLDAMMAEWNGKGIRLGYPIATTPSTIDIDVDAGVPDSAYEAIITNLAMRLAPGVGKTLNPATKMTARNALNVLYSRATFPPEMRLPSMPAGAGAKAIYSSEEFTSPPEDQLQIGSDGIFVFE